MFGFTVTQEFLDSLKKHAAPPPPRLPYRVKRYWIGCGLGWQVIDVVQATSEDHALELARASCGPVKDDEIRCAELAA